MSFGNVFTGDGFNAIELTEAINLIPNEYGLLEQLNLFPAKSVRTRNIAVESYDGVLNLLPTQKPGAEPIENRRGDRKVRNFNTLHIPAHEIVLPGDIANIRAFGQQSQLAAYAEYIMERGNEMAAKQRQTLEYLRCTALAGKVLDADTTELLDIFAAFDISETSVNFVLGTATTDILGKCSEVRRHITKQLKGDTMTGIVALCSEGFWDSFIGHAKVREAYNFHRTRSDQNPLADDVSMGFHFGGIYWREYIGEATDKDGNTRSFIPANTVRFAPLGTQNTFRTFFSPAEWNDTVNTPGLPLYFNMEERRGKKGWDLWTEANPLPLCMRPAVLVKGTKS